MPYPTGLLNIEIVPLDRAVEAYESFHNGSAKKYAIDPHNTTKLASGRTGERIRAQS
jgi:glutathione-independent formaldehyde dehydrogenase